MAHYGSALVRGRDRFAAMFPHCENFIPYSTALIAGPILDARRGQWHRFQKVRRSRFAWGWGCFSLSSRCSFSGTSARGGISLTGVPIRRRDGALFRSVVSCPQPPPARPAMERLGWWGFSQQDYPSPAPLQPRTDSFALGRCLQRRTASGRPEPRQRFGKKKPRRHRVRAGQ